VPCTQEGWPENDPGSQGTQAAMARYQSAHGLPPRAGPGAGRPRPPMAALMPAEFGIEGQLGKGVLPGGRV
jgi:hypothetical protein